MDAIPRNSRNDQHDWCTIKITESTEFSIIPAFSYLRNLNFDDVLILLVVAG